MGFAGHNVTIGIDISLRIEEEKKCTQVEPIAASSGWTLVSKQPLFQPWDAALSAVCCLNHSLGCGCTHTHIHLHTLDITNMGIVNCTS